jgi:hypothetical protein
MRIPVYLVLGYLVDSSPKLLMLFLWAVYEVYGPTIPTSDAEFPNQFWFGWFLSTGGFLISGPARICVRYFAGIMESHGRMILTAKPEEIGKNPAQCHFVHHKSHVDVPGSEPGHPWSETDD